MAERVESLISVVVPQIVGSGVSTRIKELEASYGSLDWRVALTIAKEIATEKFCSFKDKKEAYEVGIRVGLAYLTMGTVASPIEGFLEIKIKKRADGKEYWALSFGGPIRSAGGTAAAVCVVIGDYIRRQMGYEPYDPTEDEVNRMVSELYDYHERVTNLQYLPSEEELRFFVSHLPIEIDGDPSEKFEVSNYKDLPRVETNRLRNGVCLVWGEGLTQKSAKINGRFIKWRDDFDMNHWKFLDDFVKLQKKIRSKGEVKEKEVKIAPDFNFIKDLVAGRPVLGYPMVTGGFRLRYGRCRNTGLSSCAISPATMHILKNYISLIGI